MSGHQPPNNDDDFGTLFSRGDLFPIPHFTNPFPRWYAEMDNANANARGITASQSQANQHSPMNGPYGSTGFDNHFSTPIPNQYPQSQRHHIRNSNHTPDRPSSGPPRIPNRPNGVSGHHQMYGSQTESTPQPISYYGGVPIQSPYNKDIRRYPGGAPPHLAPGYGRPQTTSGSGRNVYSCSQQTPVQPVTYTGYWNSRFARTPEHTNDEIEIHVDQNATFYQPQLNSLAPIVMNPVRNNSMGWKQKNRPTRNGMNSSRFEACRKSSSCSIGDGLSSRRVPLSPLDVSFSPVRRYLIDTFGTTSARSDAECDKDNPRYKVLQACGQITSIPINLLFDNIEGIQKVNEGVFGEVYTGNFHDDQSSVYKLVPIEGELRVNAEEQKKYHQIESEIIVSQRLTSLRDLMKDNYTDGFCHLFRCRLLEGAYPPVLVHAWRKWNGKNKSDNDLPIFGPDQLYVVFEFEHCGIDMESYTFENAEKAYRIFIQVIFALAVAESEIHFEHRDLHWGNILVMPTEASTIYFRHEGIEYEVPSGGLKSSIIDFTMARCDNEDENPVFDNLENDEDQFKGYSDYQFEIYRMMRSQNNNNWRDFNPKSNVFWLKYLCDKFLKQTTYTNRNTKSHKTFMALFKTLFDEEILKYSSCSEFVKSQDQYMKPNSAFATNSNEILVLFEGNNNN